MSKFQLLLSIFLSLGFSNAWSQTFWTESFGAGCDAEVEANGFSTANGMWSVVETGPNGTTPNTWYISAKASAVAPGACSNSCETNPLLNQKSLHIGTNPLLNLYDGASFSPSSDAITTSYILSPIIDLTDKCYVEISFEYVLGGDGLNSNAQVFAFDGTNFYALPTIFQSEFCELFGAEWRSYSAVLPSEVYFSDNIQFGFLWENEAIPSPENLSFAVNNIALTELPKEQPAIICPQTQTLEIISDCSITLGDLTNLITVSDLCYPNSSLTITQSPADGTTLGIGSHNIMMSVENPSSLSNSCAFTVNVEDNIEPIIANCAPNQEVYLNADCEINLPDYRALLDVADNCTELAAITITQIPAPGSIVAGDIEVFLMAADQQGNSTECSFQLTTQDTIKPVLSCPDDVAVYLDAACGAAIPDLSTLVSATDNCSDATALIFEQFPLAGESVIGIDEINITVIDASNNAGTCSVILEKFDTIAPTILCPVQQNFNLGLDCELSLPDLTLNALVSENCSGWTILQSPAEGTSIAPGLTEITLTVSDVYGNEGFCTFNVNVFEDINPTIQCPEDIKTCDATVVYPNPVGNDNCSVFTVNQVDNSNLTSGDNFPFGITEQLYEIIDPSGNKNTCSFTIEVVENPINALILTPDRALCDTSSIFLQAQVPFSGQGEWTVFSGNAAFNNQFANETGANNIAEGENKYVWTVTSPSCGISSDTITVTRYRSPLPASTIGDQFLCSDTIVNIAANAASAGQGLWYSPNPAISFVNANSAATQAYNLSPGWNDLIWEISNGTCPASRDTMQVYYGAFTTLLTADTTLCLENNQIIADGGETPAGVFNTWAIIAGSGNILSPTASVTEIINLAGGTNKIVFSQSQGFCPTIRDTLTVIVEVCNGYNPVMPTVFTPNNDGKNDLFVVDQLHNLYPFCEVKIVNRWGNLVFESVGYERPWDGTRNNAGDELPLGTYFYRIRLNDGSGIELTGPISIVR